MAVAVAGVDPLAAAFAVAGPAHCVGLRAEERVDEHVSRSRSRSGLACASCSSSNCAGSMLGPAVIVLLHSRVLWKVHSKDSPGGRAYVGGTRSLRSVVHHSAGLHFVRTGGAAPVPGPAPAPAPEAPRSFVPLTGPATWHPADPPREGSVEFTDHRRTVVPADRAAMPVLTKAADAEATHPSVALLGHAALLALRLVASGRFTPGPGRWEPSTLSAEDTERVQMLAPARARGHRRPGTARTRSPRRRRRHGCTPAGQPRAAPPRAPERGRTPRRTPHDTRLRAPTPGPDRPPRARTAPGEPAPPRHDRAAGGGRRGGTGRGGGAAGAPGDRRARPAARLRRRAAVDRGRRGARVRRAGQGPRRPGTEARGRGVAGARPVARPARARPDHPRHRRDRLAARRGRRGAGRARHRGAVAAIPGARPDHAHRPRAPPAGREAGGAAPGADVRRGQPVQLRLAGRAARRPADAGGDGPAGELNLAGAAAAARPVDGGRPGRRPPREEADGAPAQADCRRWPPPSPASSRSRRPTPRSSSAPPSRRSAAASATQRPATRSPSPRG